MLFRTLHSLNKEVEHMQFEDAKREIERLRLQHFPEDFTFTVEVKPRIRRWYGRCSVKWANRNHATLTFAADLFKLLDDKHQIQTIRHEVAHALAFNKTGTIGHNNAWKLACIVVGCRPERTNVAADCWYRYITECTCCGHRFYKFHRLTFKRRYNVTAGGCPNCKGPYGCLQLHDMKEGKVILRGKHVIKEAA
jgi:predicted SprT family Zn-dependent metalloprotease